MSQMPDKICVAPHQITDYDLDIQEIGHNGAEEYIRKDMVDDMLATAEDHAYFAGSENAREEYIAGYKAAKEECLEPYQLGFNNGKEDIIKRIRIEIDKIYEKYEGNPLIEKEDIMFGFENIINDYYEEQSIM